MEGTQSTTCETILVTPSQADTWLVDARYERQRDINRDFVNLYAQRMESGEFLQGTPINFAAYPDGRRTLINGQHTLAAIKQTGKPYLLTVIWHHVASDEQTAHDYSVLDGQRQRTVRDSLRAYGLEHEVDLPRKDVESLGAAVELIYSNFFIAKSKTKRLSDMARYKIILEWAHEMRMYRGLIGKSDSSKPFVRMGVCAVALITLKYCPSDKTDDFWRQAVLDDGLRRGDPRKTLHEWLWRTGSSGGSKSPRFEQHLNAEGMSRGTAVAWNAWMSNRDISFIRVNHPYRDIAIAGTVLEAR